MVDKQAYLLELGRYIVLNPVRANMVKAPCDWPWSSYSATTGDCLKPEWLTIDWLLASFAKKSATAVSKYKKFVAQGVGCASPWEQLKSQVYLGDETFVEQIKSRIDNDRDLSEIPSSQRRPIPKCLTEYEKLAHSRNLAIINAYRSGGYTLKEIGEHFGLHYSRVSRIVQEAKGKT